MAKELNISQITDISGADIEVKHYEFKGIRSVEINISGNGSQLVLTCFNEEQIANFYEELGDTLKKMGVI